MVVKPKEIKRGASWSAIHGQLFGPSFDHDAAAIASLKYAIDNKMATLCDMVSGGKITGAFAYLISRDNEMGVLGAGSIAADSSFSCVVDFIEQEAIARGCIGINIETFRRGLIKLFHDAGYRIIHVALWKGLKNGQ